ncbi:hypothetical protein F4776DRAFT_663414 [Hypoxylon sp. NC0597]|nr:hypothetical protein F4776DRAFT_663414 [Hypoxylon sp. NC0597]
MLEEIVDFATRSVHHHNNIRGDIQDLENAYRSLEERKMQNDLNNQYEIERLGDEIKNLAELVQEVTRRIDEQTSKSHDLLKQQYVKQKKVDGMVDRHDRYIKVVPGIIGFIGVIGVIAAA